MNDPRLWSFIGVKEGLKAGGPRKMGRAVWAGERYCHSLLPIRTALATVCRDGRIYAPLSRNLTVHFLEL